VIGNAGTDPEMRYTPNGAPVTSFRLATNRRYKTADGEQHEETEWFTITAWNRLAETVNQYVTKGMKVYAEGRLKSGSWTGQDGETRFRNEIIANDVRFLDRRDAGARGEMGEGEGAAEEGQSAVEDLPW
jgi:single-strand DNA-binding protein